VSLFPQVNPVEFLIEVCDHFHHRRAEKKALKFPALGGR
jgi:hypothetical protein